MGLSSQKNARKGNGPKQWALSLTIVRLYEDNVVFDS
jgi:hypothetical protein